MDRSEEERYIKIGQAYEKAIHEKLDTFVVSYENDGDYTEVEIMLATCDEETAMLIAENVPKNEYAYAFIRTFRGTNLIRTQSLYTDTMAWSEY